MKTKSALREMLKDNRPRSALRDYFDLIDVADATDKNRSSGAERRQNPLAGNADAMQIKK